MMSLKSLQCMSPLVIEETRPIPMTNRVISIRPSQISQHQDNNYHQCFLKFAHTDNIGETLDPSILKLCSEKVNQ